MEGQKKQPPVMAPASFNDTDYSFTLPEQTCQRFTLAEIQSATYNFDKALVIGRGGFGKVYKCPSKTRTRSKVAFKRLHVMSNQGTLEFEAEVKVLSKLRHGNLVSLIGYCNEGNEMVLAYEFMPNGTLKDHLCKVDSVLSWLQRLKICIGAARGLDYLHTGTSTRDGVIHRDVKTSNILLDANFAAKLSDFGLAKVGPIDQTRTYVSTGVKGTFGYMDPCYFYTGKLTRKSDVYAFGVVLFEVLTGRQAVDSTLDEEQWGLAAWAQDQIKVGNLNQIVDSRLTGQISRKCLKEFASIAGCCLSIQPKQRPTMAEVVVKLEFILSQERECANSAVNERRFIYKVRCFFTGKVDAMPDVAVASKPVMLDGAVGSKSDFVAHHIEESGNQSLRTFTYPELVSATNGFKHMEYSLALNETIYKGWVDERTYAPTKYGVGMAMYVRKKHVLKSKILTIYCNLKLEEFNHPNLIKLLGYCLNEQELFCIYELIPDTPLDKYLYGGVGVKREIYDFGVVLLEILTGKVYNVRRPLGKQKLVKWAIPLLKKFEDLSSHCSANLL
ncbi:hypothetical protein L2E82_38532 [Cichorium intybus]|uniref:Uncharacterized protein n=1 Tax=Cichorium intybus TaxID=13427 RepID=A0ACB9AFX9_CICIN|nr:hypothetical protein L2E82_38532 [Cichorium intybus]